MDVLTRDVHCFPLYAAAQTVQEATSPSHGLLVRMHTHSLTLSHTHSSPHNAAQLKMTSNIPCSDGCCGEEAARAVPQMAAEPAKDTCHAAAAGYGDVHDDVGGTESTACADACWSPENPTTAASIAVQVCRAAEFPSCCAAAPCPTGSGARCRAPTAPVCCSPQVDIAPSPTSATVLTPPSSKPSDLHRWRRAAMLVSLATIAWNIVEGSLSVVYGAENVSVSLLGFGADSWVEVLSAIVVAHRFLKQEASRSDTTAKEKRATLIIGSLLLVLAVSIIGGGISALSLHETPDSSVSGIAISSAAIGVMTALYFAKVHIAFALSSSTMESDAQCSLCCIQLSSVLFIGSLVSHSAGDSVWWFDDATALIIALLVGREGFNAVRNARRSDFNGCGCCDENSGWYMRWLRKRQRDGE